ncbi:MAG: PAS domain S-box protein, partial [Gammaproteobacteria bacterium]
MGAADKFKPGSLDFRRLMEAAPDAILVVDRDGMILFGNEQAVRLFGYPGDELVGMRVETLVPARYRGGHPRLRDEYYDRPSTRDLRRGRELIAVTRAGEEVSVAISLSQIDSPEGPLTVTAIRDVRTLVAEDQERARRALSAQLLLCASEIASESASVDQALQGVIDRVCELTGWPLGHAYEAAQDDPDELTATQLWHLSDMARFEKFRQETESLSFMRGVGIPGQVLATGAAIWLEDFQDAGSNFPRAGCALDAGLRAAFAFPVTVAGKVVAVLEFFADRPVPEDRDLMQIMDNVGRQVGRVFERRQAARSIAEGERQFRTLVENVPGAIYRYSNHGEQGWVFDYMSDAIEEISGYAASEFIGQPADAFGRMVHPDDRDMVRQQVNRVLAREEVPPFEHRILRKDGAHRWVRDTIVRHCDENGRLVQYDGVVEDI